MDVTVISTSPKKEKEAREVLGADHFVVSKDEKQMAVRCLQGSGFCPPLPRLPAARPEAEQPLLLRAACTGEAGMAWRCHLTPRSAA